MEQAKISKDITLTTPYTWEFDDVTPNRVIMLEPLGFKEEDTREQIFSLLFGVLEGMVSCKDNGQSMIEPFVMAQPRISELYERGQEKDFAKLVKGKRWDPLGTFFDLKKLSKYINIIPYSKFEIRKLPLCYYYEKHIPKNEQEAFGDMFQIEKIEETTRGRIPPTEGIVGVFIYQRRDPRWLGQKILQYVEPHPDIIEKAAAFPLERPYLAVHWRRGDRRYLPGNGQIYADTCTAEFVVSRIQAVLQSFRNIKSIFLATNCEIPESLDYIKKNAPIPVHIYPRATDWEYEIVHTVIENQICVNSNLFLRFSESSFSQLVGFKRDIMGWPNINNILFGCV